jgi:lipopolysaccharide export system permease protein
MARMILSRYVGWQLVRGWVIVFAILISLFALLSLLDEIDSLSERYRFLHALYYVAFTTPQRILELSPVVAALGTVLAFAVLSRHSELVVMRAAGVSLRGLLRMCLLPTLCLVLGLALAGELLVADLHHRAETRRSVLRSGNLDLLEGRGLWSSSGARFINVRELRVGRTPEDISLYEFARDGSLLRAVEAESAELLPDRRWRLLGVRTKEWTADGLHNQQHAELDLGPFWSAEELPVLGQSLAAMPPSALYRYAEHLRSTQQDDSRVRLAFWQKVALPLSAAAMVLLSIVIGVGFGTTRSAAFGWRVLAGAVIGVGFYLLTQILHTGGQLLGLTPSVVVMLPVVLVVALAAGVAAATR